MSPNSSQSITEQEATMQSHGAFETTVEVVDEINRCLERDCDWHLRQVILSAECDWIDRSLHQHAVPVPPVWE